MVRKLALAVSFALGTLSVPVHALGLGELSSKSTLNQNFEGDIALLSVDPEELDGVRVKLADPEAFTRAGVDRPFYLSLLKFEPMLSSRGRPVIHVTSEFPIREPFMNFLVEVNWPKGRLLREYTVLLDPPTTTRRRPPAVAPVAKAAPAAKATATAPVAAQPAPAAAPPTVATVGAEGGEYGPVKSNETAWSIAKKLRPRGVTMEQMMMALLRANPQAFLDGNINRLRRGQILRVPAPAEIQELSRQEARTAYRQQQDEWLARRDQKLQQAAKEEAAKEEAGEQATETAGPVAEAATDDQLRIATARPEGSGEAGAGDDNAEAPIATDLKSRLLVARENAETSRQEAEVLRARVDDLQARLQDMQRLLSLKDDQLAQLQDRVGGEQAAAAAEPVPDAELGAGAGEPPVGEATPPVDVTAAAETAPEGTTDAGQPVIEPVAEVEGAATDVSVAVSEAAEEVIQAAVEPVTPAPETIVEDYVIADIPPQIDPDRLVRMADADGVIREGAPEAAVPAESEAAVAIEEAAPVTAEGELVVVEPDAAAVAEQAPVEAAGVVVEPDAAVVAEQVPGEPLSLDVEPSVVTAEPEPAETSVTLAEEVEQAVDKLIPAPLARVLKQNMLPIAAGGVTVLGLLGWLLVRGRRKPGAGEPAPDAATAAATTAGAAAVAVAVADETPAEATAGADSAAVDQPVIDDDVLADLPDSAFLDELEPGAINALQDETGEVDPVSEADVYIAYGRYQQAEELLRQALNRDPDRLALKHKLLEVHYATRDADAFNALAQEMADAGQAAADPEAWSRAQDMGRDLAPQHSLYTGGVVPAVAVSAAVAGAVAAAAAPETETEVEAELGDELVDEDTLSLEDLEMSELNAAYAEESTPLGDLEAPSEVSITLDLEEASNLSQPTEPAEPEALSLDEIEAMDFELPEAEQAAAQAQDLDSDELMGDTLDLEAMMAEAEAAVDQDDSTMSIDSEFSAAELQAQLDELSELSVLHSELDEPSETGVPGGLGLVAEDSGVAVDAVDEPFSLDSELTADDGEDELPELLSVGAGASVETVAEDEVATKLDLARAYVDMGDDDGARSILEEVVVEGTDSQRGDAEQLLAKIG